MKLSVVIPCFNEIGTIAELVRRVRASPYPDKEIIVVDDCSTDGTRQLLLNNQIDGIDHVLLQEAHQGKGAAVRAGIKQATGGVIVIQDADLEYDPAEYTALIQPILAGQADVVYGSRFQGSQPRRVLYFWHRVANGVLTCLSNMFTDLNLSDMECGYKMFRREVVQSIELEESGFGFDPEITAKIAKLKVRIYEVGISYHGRTYAEGKKIGWRDAFLALYCIVKYSCLRKKPE